VGSEQGNWSYGAPEMRTSAADRERAVDVLKAAYSEGRLPRDEFDVRCARVMEARTYGELTPLIADLPGGHGFATNPGRTAAYPRTAYYPVPRSPNSGLAIASLVCGVGEIFTGGLSGIAAVILGHMARNEIRQTGKRGDGMAIAGLVLGYLAIAGWALIIVIAVVAGIAATSHPSIAHSVNG
jgi:hypothetical protein